LIVEYQVYFARRGSSDRTAAFSAALEHARRNFSVTWNRVVTASVAAIAGSPAQLPGLQAVDYFLWALQRLYEQQDERYLEFVWPKVGLVHDVDDTRQKQWEVLRQAQAADFGGLPAIGGTGDIGQAWARWPPAKRHGAEFRPPVSLTD
jgi:hypothetical protein